MAGKYDIQHPTVVDASAEDPITGTVWNKSWEDDNDTQHNAAHALIEADVVALQAVSYLYGYDSILYTYKDAATVTVHAGGQCTSADQERFYSIAAETDVGFAGNLANGESEQADTNYYLWIGENSSSEIEIVLSANISSAPNESGSATPLSHAHRLRGILCNRDGGSNNDIIPFFMTGSYYEFRTNDLFVYNGTLTDTFTDIDCSDYIPDGCVRARVVGQGQVGVTYGQRHYYRMKGDTHNGFSLGHDGCTSIASALIDVVYEPLLDSNGLYEAHNDKSAAYKVLVIGFFLD